MGKKGEKGKKTVRKKEKSQHQVQQRAGAH